LAERYKNGGKMNRTKNNEKHDKIIQYFPQETKLELKGISFGLKKLNPRNTNIVVNYYGRLLTENHVGTYKLRASPDFTPTASWSKS
jgi:hypothetical protein